MTVAAETLSACARAAQAMLAEGAPRRADDAAFYLAHVEGAAPLRGLAEASGRAPSSVHRAIRRVEALRDDPLIDLAFDALGHAARRALSTVVEDQAMPHADRAADAPSPEYAERVAERALERLCEPEAFLMVAKGAERAGVFCRKNKFRRPLALITVEMAAELAARDWVRPASRTAVSTKYVVSPAGRAWLRRRRAEAEAQEAPVVASVPTPFAAQHAARGERHVARADGGVDVIRVNLGESPLGWLATRRGPDGAPFLTQDEVEAGERLRADFERAQMGPRVAQDWSSFLSPRDAVSPGRGPAEGPTDARLRVGRALEALGPGLADVALRSCCFLEGLEATERRMGWSARSGKVVLKIALQRLSAHYGLKAAA